MKPIKLSDPTVTKCASPFFVFMLMFTWLGFSGCSSKDSSMPTAETNTTSENPERWFEDFNSAKFSQPTLITNPWLPLKPGSQWVYEGSTMEDDEVIPHRIVFTVTDLTKEIAGVQAVVALILDYAKDEMVEQEIAFYAQDDNGNIWFLGEYPEEYEEGQVVKTPAWIPGIEDAKAGIMMLAKPQLGTPSYPQGWGPAVDWTDRGTVYQVGQKTSVPYGSYYDVLVIDETASSEPDAHQLKYYARNIGNVRVGWTGQDESKEELALVQFSQLDPEALAKVRAETLELERRAYKTSPTVYALTKPINGHDVQVAPQAGGTQPMKIAQSPAVQMISEGKAKEIALQTVPGNAIDVSIERKLGANRYVVEVLAKEDGSETDVIIDMHTGKVLATEK
jgi:uncharacterized membrane protein YkoI